MGVNILRRVFSWILRKIYQINCEGEENLKILRDHLERGSVILCFNHLSFDDTIILLAALFLEIRRGITKMVVPFSRKHWGRPWGRLVRLASLLGLRISPIVQHYQRDVGLYSPEHITSLDRQFVKAVYEILGTEGGALLFAPEGHRTETRRLQPPQKGVEFLLRLIGRRDFETKVVPIGIEPPEGYSRRFNPGKRFVIHFGPPLSVKEIKKRAQQSHTSLGWVIMKEIAQLLPGYST